MKTTIKTTNIQQTGKTYKEGTIEIDDEQKQITLKTTTGLLPSFIPFLQKKEKTLATTTYNETDFPQLERDTLNIQNATTQITSPQDQQTIADIVTKPHTELRAKIENNLTQAEKTLKETLQTRAEVLDYLTQLKDDPRKTLFTTDPQLLAETELPIEEATKKQKTKIETALATFRANMAAYSKEGKLNQDATDTLTRIAIAIATAQDAQFQRNDAEIQTTNQLLQTMGATNTQPDQTTTQPESSITQKTQTQTNQLTAKTHQTLTDNISGTTKCPKCNKYTKINQNQTQTCTYCQ